MQNRTQQPPKVRRDSSQFFQTMGFLWRFRSHPETLEPFLDSLRAGRMSETNVATVRALFIAWRQAYRDTETVSRIDRYLAAGMGAVDLVLLPVVLPMGVSDRPLFLAVLSLAISLVLVAVSLFVNFVKQQVGITGYGKVHGTMASLALYSGGAALTATLWHLSRFIGILFLVLAVTAYLACSLYFVAAKMAVGYFTLQSAFNAPAADANTSSKSGEPHRPHTTDEEHAREELHAGAA
jgi:hypothetical protein